VNSGAPASALEPAGPTGRKRLRVKWIPGWEPPKGVEPQGAQTHSRSSDEAISRAALAPHGPACPLTCPHESVLAVTVIDITLLLWKEKGGSCGEAGCQAGAGAPMLPPAKGGAEQQEAGEGGWREHTHPPPALLPNPGQGTRKGCTTLSLAGETSVQKPAPQHLSHEPFWGMRGEVSKPHKLGSKPGGTCCLPRTSRDATRIGPAAPRARGTRKTAPWPLTV